MFLESYNHSFENYSQTPSSLSTVQLCQTSRYKIKMFVHVHDALRPWHYVTQDNKPQMAATLLWLSVFAVSTIQLTSSHIRPSSITMTAAVRALKTCWVRCRRVYLSWWQPWHSYRLTCLSFREMSVTERFGNEQTTQQVKIDRTIDTNTSRST